MNIKYNGFIYTIIYTENDNGALNQSLYSFNNFENALSYLKKQVEDTVNRLEDICGVKYEAEGLYVVNDSNPEYRFVCIDCGEGLEYMMELRKIPIRTTDDYENPDEMNGFELDQ